MKTPRITDFDPDTKIPTLKSSLDDMPSIQKPNPIHQITPQHNTVPIIDRHKQQHVPKTINKHPASQSSKRPFVRRTFDFYDDQISYLTRQSLQERLAGKERSMNEMVREALEDNQCLASTSGPDHRWRRHLCTMMLTTISSARF